LKFVIDTSVIIAFCTECKRPELLYYLKEKNNELYMPNAVSDEIKETDITYKLLYDLKTKKIIKNINTLDKNDILEFKNKHPYLNNGEIEVILWGIKLKNKGVRYCCVIDDGKARKIAQLYKIKFTGTLGLLNKMVDLEILSSEEKNKIINKLKDAGFRIKLP